MEAAGNRTSASVKAIRKELDRVLGSQAFSSADRRARLLRFLVEERLSERAGSLKEAVIAMEVFDRGDYDPALDSIVRVEMGRLRSRLTEYYSQAGRNSRVRIEIPKGSYEPTFVFSGGERIDHAPQRSRARLAIAAAIVVLLAAFAVWRLRTPNRPSPATIAVLPFLNLSGDPAKEYLGDSLTDELTETLAESKDLRVVARTSAFEFKGKGEERPPDRPRPQRQRILEGSISVRDGRFLVVVQLIRSADGYHLWSRTYEATASELARVETEVADSAEQALAPAHPGVQAKPVASPSPAAHDLYMRAIYQIQLHTADSLREGLGLAQEAVRIDPQYVRAYFAIARAETMLSAIGVISGREGAELGRAAAKKALELDPGYSDAHAYMAHSMYVYDWNWPEAEKEYALALGRRLSRTGAQPVRMGFDDAQAFHRGARPSSNRRRTGPSIPQSAPEPGDGLDFEAEFPGRETGGCGHFQPLSEIDRRHPRPGLDRDSRKGLRRGQIRRTDGGRVVSGTER